MDEGLDDLAKSIETNVRRGSVSRYGNLNSGPEDFKPNSVGGITSTTLVTAVLDRVNKFEPLTKLADQPMEQRLLTSPVPERLGIAIVRLESHFPTTRQRWLSIIDTGMRISGLSNTPLSATQVLMDRDFYDENMAPFSFDVLKQRFNYVDERPESERESAKPEGVSAPDNPG